MRCALVGNRYMFTGRELDLETGLYYYRFRYYSATLGRFLQRDPMGDVEGMNLYAYVRNMPVSRKDAYGLESSDEVEKELRKLLESKFPSIKSMSVTRYILEKGLNSMRAEEFNDLNEQDQAGRSLTRLLDIAKATEAKDVPEAERIEDCKCGSWASYVGQQWLRGEVPSATPKDVERLKAEVGEVQGAKIAKQAEELRAKLRKDISKARGRFYRVDYVYWDWFSAREVAASALAGSITAGLGGPLLYLVRHDLGVNDTHAGIRVFFYSGEEFYMDNGLVPGKGKHFFKKVPASLTPKYSLWSSVD